MAGYPETKDEPCRHCGATVTWRRVGTGRPWRGRLDYSYTTDHRCPEMDLARQAMAGQRAAIERGLAKDA